MKKLFGTTGTKRFGQTLLGQMPIDPPELSLADLLVALEGDVAADHVVQ